MNNPTFFYFFESGKWKGREKIQKFQYLENEKSFLDEIKSILQFLKGHLMVKK